MLLFYCGHFNVRLPHEIQSMFGLFGPPFASIEANPSDTRVGRLPPTVIKHSHHSLPSVMINANCSSAVFNVHINLCGMT